MLATLIENHLTVEARVYLWDFCFSLVCVSVFMPVPHSFDYDRLVISFETRKCESSSFMCLAHFCDTLSQGST